MNADLHATDPRFPKGYTDLARVLLGMLPHGGPCLMAVCGDRGRGKTHLACGLIREFCSHYLSAIYRRTARFFDRLGEADWGQKEAVRREYLSPKLLVLDEVQIRDQNKQKQDNELTTLIDERYARRRRTLLLSNFKPDALMQNVGPSIWRRLVEEGGVYETNWPRIQEILGGGQ